MKNKLIWICGIPSSGKTTMAIRLWLELDWAGKKSVLLDDHAIKDIMDVGVVGKIITLLNGEYTILVTPYIQYLPKKPELIVWCKSPISECAKRDTKKDRDNVGDKEIKERFLSYWGNYYIGADLVLNTYARRKKNKHNVELCWKELKEKMEEVFGDFKWNSNAYIKSAWDSCEPSI